MKTRIKKNILFQYLKNNKVVILYSVLFIVVFFFCNILNNYLEYKSYEEEISQYNLVEFQDLGLIVKDSSLIKIENAVNMYDQNETLQETAEYLDLDTSEIIENAENVYEQNIALTDLIHTKDANYEYKPVKKNTTNYVNIMLLFFILLIVVVRHKKIFKFIYTNSSNRSKLFFQTLYKYIKYPIIIFGLLLLFLFLYFGRNYSEYKAYENDINKYELTNYQNVGFIIKETTLENIKIEINNQKKLEDLILEAEELGININEILLPSITNTETQIEILSQAIENYIPPKSSDNSDIDEQVEEDNVSIESSEEQTQVYYAETENTTPNDICDSTMEDCDGDGDIDSPPIDEEKQCNSEIEDCNEDESIDDQPIDEEKCDLSASDCDGDGEIDTPPINEELCDPITEDCNGDGEIDSPEEPICNPDDIECVETNNL